MVAIGSRGNPSLLMDSIIAQPLQAVQVRPRGRNQGALSGVRDEEGTIMRYTQFAPPVPIASYAILGTVPYRGRRYPSGRT